MLPRRPAPTGCPACVVLGALATWALSSVLAPGSASAWRSPFASQNQTPNQAKPATETPNPAQAVPQPADGPVFIVRGRPLKVGICAANIVRVTYAADPAVFARPTLVTAAKRCAPTPWHVDTAGGVATVATSELRVRVDLARGSVRFHDAADRLVLAERGGQADQDNGRELVPAVVSGEQTFHVRQQWEPQADESLYGLGQHQQGLIDIKDHDLELRQYNTEIFIPFLVSSRGYGVLWDNTSFTRFGDLADPVPLPVDAKAGLYAAPGPKVLPGDVAAKGGGSFSWSGTVTPRVTGDHVFRTYSAGGIQLRVDGKLVIDHWRQGWLPNVDVARVPLTAGRPVAVALAWTRDIGVNIANLTWKPPVTGRTTSLWSEVGDAVDYTFVYGPDLDRVIAGYRQLTGAATVPPRWAFGLWQCRERYTTQRESIDVLDGFRKRQFPVDNIVQDWRYWPEGSWGSHAFDAQRFPDPAGWIREIHDRLHARLMISVWPKFYTGTANFRALEAAGFLYRPDLDEQKVDFLKGTFTYYDAFSPEARRMYWSQINEALFSKGVDAWWMDASEPEVVEGPFPSVAAQVETYRTHMNPTAAGSGARMLNAYPLLNSQAIAEGQLGAAPNQRVYILTRSGFAGMQRYGALSWSGDITSTWTAMRKQIPAGLSYSISGMPYWTLDSGGFAVPGRFASAARGSADLDEWRELQTRWFEYATFLPIMRVHGQSPKREPWEYGGDDSPAYHAQKKFARLRYRLLPYVYALAGAAFDPLGGLRGGTLLRPLVMDFRGDKTARQIGDQFLFGPALLVSPVTTYKARSRSVYLPATRGGWYDLWTGAAVPAGSLEARAAFDEIPVHVRAGSIVPVGPELQYTGEKAPDPITWLVYAGADGSFSLYEDQGTTNDYLHGARSRIPLTWTDATRTLVIGKREGSFPGMLARRTFQVVRVAAGQPVPFPIAATAAGVGQRVDYKGEAVTLQIR